MQYLIRIVAVKLECHVVALMMYLKHVLAEKVECPGNAKVEKVTDIVNKGCSFSLCRGLPDWGQVVGPKKEGSNSCRFVARGVLVRGLLLSWTYAYMSSCNG